MNFNEFRKEYFNKCTEKGLYSKVTKSLIKLGLLVPLCCILLIILVLVIDQEYTIRFALLVLVLLGYPLILLWQLYKEKKKISMKKPIGLGICQICKWYEMANKEIMSILECNFSEFLSNYKINQDDHKQIDLIVDIISNNPTKEKRKRRLNVILSSIFTIIGSIGLMFWESEFYESPDIANYIILTIYGYILYQLIKYIFQGIFIKEQADLDKELIYKLKCIQLSKVRDEE